VSTRVLVVGDRFIPAPLFADGVKRAAREHALDLAIEMLELPYPAVDQLPLPQSVSGAEFRPLWETPDEMIRRAETDLAADPDIREYTGPVDLLLPRISDVEVLLVHMAPVSRHVVAAAPRLRAVGCARGGPVNVNIAALSARHIPVFNCPGRNSRAVAEFLAGAIVAHTRGLTAGSRALAEDAWRLDLFTYDLAGHELFGRTCGMLGFGAVGHAFAPIARGFGLHVLVHDPYVSDADLAEAEARRADSLDHLLASADVVIVAARLTAETRGMLGARELGLLRPGALFVNTARSEIVDGAALRAAVSNGLRVVVDVFSPEPVLRDDPLLESPNALLTPHIAGASRESAERGVRGVADAVAAYLVDGSLRQCVNARSV
jgi:D-3-phosphoglycerate dehydrogenase / 2-oxoglutarate reductase